MFFCLIWEDYIYLTIKTIKLNKGINTNDNNTLSKQ